MGTIPGIRYQGNVIPENKNGLHITDAGVQSLTTLIHLRELKVDGAHRVTDASVRALVALPRLRALAMPHSPNLTAEGLRSLLAAPWLRQLDFTGCSLFTNCVDGPYLTDLDAFLDQRDPYRYTKCDAIVVRGPYFKLR